MNQENVSELLGRLSDGNQAYFSQALPELLQYTQTIESVHGDNHPELAILLTQYMELKEGLTNHLVKEEEELFPLIRRLEQAVNAEELQQCRGLIQGYELEHQIYWDSLQRMRELLNDYTLPDDACPTYRAAFRKLQALESEWRKHVLLEEENLFPRFANAAQ